MPTVATQTVQNLHVVIPVADRPFELPPTLRHRQEVVHRAYSALVKQWNSLLGKDNANKFPGFLDMVRSDIRLTLANPINGQRGLKFDLGGAPHEFTEWVRANIGNRNDIFEQLAPTERMGGNNLNVLNTRLAWLRVFKNINDLETINVQLPKEVALVSDDLPVTNQAARYLTSQQEQFPDLLEVRTMGGVPFRRSLHTPFTNETGNPDTLMIGEPHPSRESVHAAAERAFADLLEQVEFQSVYTPFNIAEISKQVRLKQRVLIPSSAFPEDAKDTIESGYHFAGNDVEFKESVEKEFPDMTDGLLTSERYAECNQIAKRFWTPRDDVPFAYLTALGLRSGGTMALYSCDGSMYALQAGRVDGTEEGDFLEFMSCDSIGKNLPGANTTGGGDSKVGTQTILAELLPEYLETYDGLSPKQRQLAAMAAGEILASMTAFAVRNSTEASLVSAPEHLLQAMLHKVLRVVCEEVVAKEGNQKLHIEGPYGVHVLIWEVE